MKTKKKKIILTVALLIVVLIVFFIYYFFMNKKYTFYIKEDIGEIQAVGLICYDGEYGNSINIYNKNIVNELLKALDSVKMKPFYSIKNIDNDEGFYINFIGEDNKRISYMASDYGTQYIVELGVLHDGKGIEEPVWNFIGRMCISKEDGERLYDLVKKDISENMKNITAEELVRLSEEKEEDWRVFQQYIYEREDVGKIVSKGELSCDRPERFQIEGKKGYMRVWEYEGIVAGKDETKEYQEVLKAVVYNEKGEEMDLYSDEISKFLEEME